MNSTKSIAALFDFDGVVVDTEPQYSIFWNEQGRKYHPEIPEFGRMIKGQTLTQIYNKYFAGMEDVQREITEDLNKFEENMLFNYIPGVEGFMKEKEEKLEIFIPNGPRLGNKVIEAKGVAKAYGDKLLFDNLNFMLPPNGIVGVIGPNGAGKTTLFRLIMGLETVDKGTFEVGETVKLAYVDQQHKDIDPEKSVYQVISGGNELIRLGNRDINARAYLSRFNFSGADQEKLCVYRLKYILPYLL
jgi:ABC-type multidrug transport system fused ATPase/permease subunit